MLLFVYNSVAEFVLKSNSSLLRLYVACHAIEMKPNLTLSCHSILIIKKLYCQHLRKLDDVKSPSG